MSIFEFKELHENTMLVQNKCRKKNKIYIFGETSQRDVISTRRCHLDFVIVSSRHKQRLLFVEINSSDGTWGLEEEKHQLHHVSM